MKILLVSLHFVEYTSELAKALTKDNKVHMVLSKKLVSQTVKGDLGRILGNGVSYTLLDSYTLFNPKILKNFFILILLWWRFRPDIIHHQESRDPSNLLILLFSIFIPTVGTIHDVQTHPGSDGNNVIIKTIRRFIHSRLYRKIIVHGEALKSDLLKSIGKASKDIFVIPHGGLFSFQTYSNNSIIQEEDHTILFFGRMLEYKGLRYLIEAEPLVSKEIPDFKIIVAGNGKDLTDNKRYIEVNPHFEIHDRFIPNDEVAIFFKRAVLIVIPYIEASQSGIVAMSFAFGKPVIVTDVGSLSEVVSDGKVGLVVPARDVKRLSIAIIDLLLNKEKIREMGRCALELASTRLSWEHIAHLTGEVYNNVLRAA